MPIRLNPLGSAHSLRVMSVTHPAPFESYVAPARARCGVWRLILGLTVAAVIYALWSTGLLSAYWWIASTDKSVGLMRDVAAASSPMHTYILLATFVGMALGPMIVVRFLHKRGVGSLFGRAAVVLRDFTIAAGLVAAVYAVAIGLWFWQFDAVPNLDPKLWLMLLPLSLIGIAIQTGAEELVFRGYLQQQLAARFRSPLIWMLIPSLMFGFAHYDPVTSGGNLWVIVAATTLFGLVAADLTAKTGSIGAAWGFHFANNVAALLFVAVKGTIPGLALFTTPYGAGDPVMAGLTLIDMGVLALSWLLVRRVLQR